MEDTHGRAGDTSRRPDWVVASGTHVYCRFAVVICPKASVVSLIIVTSQGDVQFHMTVAPGMGPSIPRPSQWPLKFMSPAGSRKQEAVTDTCYTSDGKADRVILGFQLWMRQSVPDSLGGRRRATRQPNDIQLSSWIGYSKRGG
jgi:hypothetical protein